MTNQNSGVVTNNAEVSNVVLSGNRVIVESIYGALESIVYPNIEDVTELMFELGQSGNDASLVCMDPRSFMQSRESANLILLINQLYSTGRLQYGQVNYKPTQETVNYVLQTTFVMSLSSMHTKTRAMKTVFEKCNISEDDVTVIKVPITLHEEGYCDYLLVAHDLDPQTVANLNKLLSVSIFGKKAKDFVQGNRPIISGGANVIMQDVVVESLGVAADFTGEVAKGVTTAVVEVGVSFMESYTRDNKALKVLTGDRTKKIGENLKEAGRDLAQIGSGVKSFFRKGDKKNNGGFGGY